MLHLWRQFPRVHKISISALSLIILGGLLASTDNAEASRHTLDNTELSDLPHGERIQLEIPSEPDPISTATTTSPPLIQTETKQSTSIEAQRPALNTISVTVKKNDSLAKIFERNNLSARTLLKVSKSGEHAETIIQQLKPGDILDITFNAKKELHQLAYPISAIETIHLQANENGFDSHIETKKVDTSEAFSFANITSSFWNAGVDAGLTESQIMNLANIFGWDIDFALDLRKGDSFNVVFEKRYIDGEYIGPGDILAAEFINQKQVYSAVKYEDGNYYTLEGNSMRKAFLRAPVNFKYISSSFNPRRLHPVTGKVRPHKGIDYAAKTGTPVSASGSGKVIKSGYSNLNGNYVFIQHGENYTTKYLHLHRRYVKKGDKVKQGQKIGTVGSTGRVTGPHLHYEFLVDGIHRNPKTVKLPKATPIATHERDKFFAQAGKMRQLLQQNKKLLIAQTN
ncbi:peptidoglycan DD-metalloendopeptidase family protein [Algibacillus agarilyticus]|uniref:peptidoglycan DD-metalloendopeptidase family protein n=1 Tax=Algibacillus agarilyticus TaxID=2234133 RepID=UPI000DCFD381|nr:peptidoglycan DD-metalloendopeptidase family protein [Algibacillus agarilyticus]